MADRIVVMRDGRIQQVGTPYELYFRPANVFVAGFIGEPPMNFVRGTVQNGCIRFGPETIDLKPVLGDQTGSYEGKPIVFGFRPEAIRLEDGADSYRFRCLVELTEMLGDNTNVYISTGDDRAILKVDPHDTPEMDSMLEFSVPYESVSLFDGETEQVIPTNYMK